MSERCYLVVTDSVTGGATAVEIDVSCALTAHLASPTLGRENYGPGREVEAAKDALGAVMPEPAVTA